MSNLSLERESERVKLVLLWFGGGAPDKLGGRTETCDVMMGKLVRSTPAFRKENKAGPFNEMKYSLNFFVQCLFVQLYKGDKLRHTKLMGDQIPITF